VHLWFFGLCFYRLVFLYLPPRWFYIGDGIKLKLDRAKFSKYNNSISTFYNNISIWNHTRIYYQEYYSGNNINSQEIFSVMEDGTPKSITVSEDTTVDEETNIRYWFNRCVDWTLVGNDRDIEKQGLRGVSAIWPLQFIKAFDCVKPRSNDVILVHFETGWEIASVISIHKRKFWIKSKADKMEHKISWKDNRWFLIGRDPLLIKLYVNRKLGLKRGNDIVMGSEAAEQEASKVGHADGKVVSDPPPRPFVEKGCAGINLFICQSSEFNSDSLCASHPLYGKLQT